MKKFLISKILAPISMSDMEIAKMIVVIPVFIIMMTFPLLGIFVLVDMVAFEVARQIIPYLFFPAMTFYLSELGSWFLYKFITRKKTKFYFTEKDDFYLFEMISFLSCHLMVKLCKDLILISIGKNIKHVLNNSNVKSHLLWCGRFNKFNKNNKTLLLIKTNQEHIINNFEDNYYYFRNYVFVAKNKESAAIVKMILP